MAGSPRFWPHALLALSLAGCATSSAAWLREPEAGMSLGEHLSARLEEPPLDAARAAPLQSEPIALPVESESRPRLQRTVTLGGEISAAEARAVPAAAPGAAPVQVVVNNYLPAYGAPYETYYPAVRPARGRADSESDSRNRARGSAPRVQPGQDFPAPPSYGPSFPYKTAPASPWQ
ncbi:MAG TPA: hypothetical protein VGK73_22595 [Polyangiaceae bacterium]